MVREMENPSAQAVTLRVFLPADDETGERIAERALGTAIAILDAGAPLIMATLEISGLVVAVVPDRRQAGRRLARAIPTAGQSRIEISR